MIQTICICGAGTMGSGIAQVCATAGYKTILFDVNAEMLIKGRLSINKGLQLLADKQKITPEAKEAINAAYVAAKRKFTVKNEIAK